MRNGPYRAPVPELVEVEAYRLLAERTVGRMISRVVAPDAWFLKRGADAALLTATLGGARITATGRVGKLLLLTVEAAANAPGGSPFESRRADARHRAETQLGLRFGMTGRLIVDGRAAVESLLYSSDRDEPGWDRFALEFADGGSLRMRDPRRLGGVELDPDVQRLGPDARTITRLELRRAFLGSMTPVKARLLDQSRVAGIGNLIGDEVLWRARIAPDRPACSLSANAVRRMHVCIGEVVEMLIERGGSHLGDLMPERHPGGSCPLDGAPLLSATLGGRTTWWCPRHQR